MTKSTTLNPITAPLSGINLIEASAGTGKTYTITTLLLRLILEKGLTIDKILVVTFTDAATEELRDRVRRRLSDAKTAFELGDSSDEVLQSLIQNSSNHQDAIFRLEQAIHGFDEAAIFTIHSFCKQMLQENAFESGSLFETELLKDQSNLLREIVEDFWRQHFYQSSPLFISYLIDNQFNTPAQLLNVLNQGRYVGQPFLKIIPELKNVPLTTQEPNFYTTLSQTQELWKSQGAEIETLLLNSGEHLNGNKYRKTSIPIWCNNLNQFCNSQLNSLTLPDKFEKFTTSGIIDGLKKNKIPPKHDFFDVCEKLQQTQKTISDNFQQHLLALKLKLLKIADESLPQKKHQHQMLSFDDLLINLYEALKGRNAKSLIKLIRRKFHAALIDEFQDTDPVQYNIFYTIFGDAKQILFLIGDPKQAIYSFRGADIFTYMSASNHAQQRYTLPTNWRSEPELIKAVNNLFEKTTNPFLFNEIPFLPVQAQKDNNKESLKIENKKLPPLQIWLAKREIANCLPEKAIPKKWATQQIPFSVGSEIARLLMLGQQALIGNRPIIAGDIAVLVRSHKQARQIQKALIQLQIPSVLFSKESIFVSHEIMEIDRILQAVAAPNNESLIKAALTTDMLGFSGSDLHKLIENDHAWQNYVSQFQYYHFIWRNIGFVQMFRKLLFKEQVQSRLLSYHNGERRLTNVLHTAEILQEIAVQQNLSINGLTQWLSQQRYQQANSDEQQLRLESDENLVKIVTIHKSKGLEYPIVFCPYVWDGNLHNKNKKNSFTFHQKNDVFLDLGSENQDKHRDLALKEEEAENLRLFYVAVTRAKHRCYLIWGAFKSASSSPLAHLLHPNIKDIEKTDDVIIAEDLQNLDESIQISDLPTDITHYHRPIENLEKLKARRFTAIIDKTWKVSSFSALSKVRIIKGKQAIDKPDYDEITVIKPYVGRIQSDKNHIFSFPRGARAGNFMHALFENLDFKAPNSELINQQLTKFGYDAERWQTVIMEMVNNVLNTPLGNPKLNLSKISRDKRLNELEFYYPLSRITPQGLESIFKEFGINIDNLDFYSIRGFMKGYIDMIFSWKGKYYIVDYKSNLLGIKAQYYQQNKLKEVMKREAYLLQYYIYTVALHRYLSIRLPNYNYENNFGGVYYLFLRGMNPESNYGIYWDLPDVELVDRLSGYLF